ncbi:MAG: cytochrome c [Halobacteriovoraceae bacterium]|jgi:mono/diheme cytochrome c family protein|nr:cytochrome c [Halobacteriovoraceae bacterium]
MKIVLSLLVLTFATASYSFDAAKYFKKTCAACHKIGGGDTPKLGPDLAGVSKRRKLDWIVKFIKYPEGMIAGDEDEKGYEKADPTAKAVFELYKPAMMAEIEITKVQVVALLKYIDSLKKQPKGKITKKLILK